MHACIHVHVRMYTSGLSHPGMLLIQPHTTVRELRLQLQTELGFKAQNEEELCLSRGMYMHMDDKDDKAAGGGSALADEQCPIPPTQNHKLVYAFFRLASHVLVVEERVEDKESGAEAVFNLVKQRALPGSSYAYTYMHMHTHTGGRRALPGERTLFVDLTLTLTLHPSPFTLHPSPFTLHASRFTLHPSPFTLTLHTHPHLHIAHPHRSPLTSHPQPGARVLNF